MRLEDLKLYQECLDFEQKIWNIVNKWEGFNKDTMGKPFLQAADSISGNIAAGYGRYNFKDKKDYCYISRGYLLNTRGWLIKAKERELIGAEENEELMEFIEKIHRMLNAYIRSIGRPKEGGHKSNNNHNDSGKVASEVSTSNHSEPNGNAFTASEDEFFTADELTNA